MGTRSCRDNSTDALHFDTFKPRSCLWKLKKTSFSVKVCFPMKFLISRYDPMFQKGLLLISTRFEVPKVHSIPSTPVCKLCSTLTFSAAFTSFSFFTRKLRASSFWRLVPYQMKTHIKLPVPWFGYIRLSKKKWSINIQHDAFS